MTDPKDIQIRKLEEMYILDTEEMRNEIQQLRKERDQWKDRCLGAETEREHIRRQLRHV